MAVFSPNTTIYKEDWTITYQAELDEPVKFFDFAKVIFSNSRLVHFPFNTDPTATSFTRNCPYTLVPVVRTDDNVTIDDNSIIPQIIDKGDLAQTGYNEQMEIAKRQAVLNKEDVESSIYNDHGNCTDFGTENLSGGAGSSQITVSSSNVDDIVRNIKRTIRTAGGESMLSRDGGFIVWRPKDLELLEGFMMANGFTQADLALKGGGGDAQVGFTYFGFTHWGSNLLAANHLLAGVKKAYYLYILRSTWGSIMVDDKDPGQNSAVAIVSRIDFREQVWTKLKPVLFDINVAT